MKRSFAAFESQGPADAGATPNRNTSPANQPAKPAGNNNGKRQATLRHFMHQYTPTLSGAALPNYMEKDTPTLLGGHASTLGGGSTSMNPDCTVSRAMENLRMYTPVDMASIGHQVGPVRHQPVLEEEDDNSRQYADTCVHPAMHPLGEHGKALSASLGGGVISYQDFAAKDDGEEADAYDDIGFRIMSSQTYTRPPTQLTPQEVADERSVSWEADWGREPAPSGRPARAAATQHPTTFGAALALRIAPAQDAMADENEDPNECIIMTQPTEPADSQGPASQRLTPLAALGAVVQLAPGQGGAGPSTSVQAHPALSTDQALTPELMPVVAVCQEAVHLGPGGQPLHVGPSIKPLAALFRPRTERKLLMIVRHGESEYNAACNASRSTADPFIFDPQLTATGIQQCADLRRVLSESLSENMSKYGEPVWVLSPLTRALQTFMLSNPFPDRLPPMQQAQLAALHKQAGVLYQPAGCKGEATSGPAAPNLHIEIHPGISEFLLTPGDVGRPPAQLMQDFPQLANELTSLPDVWWHHTGNKSSCAMSRRFEGLEPKDKRKHRVEEFARWLSKRPERLFILVGHSCFWKQFMGQFYNKSLKNCELFCMPY